MATSSSSGGALGDLPPDYVASMSGFDLTNHDSLAPWMLKTNIIVLAFVSTIVIARVIVRLLVVRTFSADDSMLDISMALLGKLTFRRSHNLCISCAVRAFWHVSIWYDIFDTRL